MQSPMLFYLPIYREAKAAFNKMFDNDLTKILQEIENACQGPISNKMKIQTEHELYKKYGKSWEQNRAVGWVSVKIGKGGFDVSIAKAHPFRSKIPRKYFEELEKNKMVGEWHTIMFNMCKSNKEIFSRLNKVLDAITSRKPFKKCIIDRSQISLISPYLDWVRLVRDSMK